MPHDKILVDVISGSGPSSRMGFLELGTRNWCPTQALHRYPSRRRDMDEDENSSDGGYGVVRMVVVLLSVRRACLGVHILSHAESHANSYSETVRVGMSVDVDRSCCIDVRASDLPHLRIRLCTRTSGMRKVRSCSDRRGETDETEVRKFSHVSYRVSGLTIYP